MRLTRPVTDPQSLCQDPAEVAPFRVVGAGHVLEVWKSGSVFDVEQGAFCEVPRDEVGAAGELVVLVWLVKTTDTWPCRKCAASNSPMAA